MIADAYAEHVPECAALALNNHATTGTPWQRLDASIEVRIFERLAEFLSVFLARQDALGRASTLEQVRVTETESFDLLARLGKVHLAGPAARQHFGNTNGRSRLCDLAMKPLLQGRASSSSWASGNTQRR